MTTTIIEQMDFGPDAVGKATGVVAAEHARPAVLVGTPFSVVGPGRVEFGGPEGIPRKGPFFVYTEDGSIDYHKAHVVDFCGGTRLGLDSERILRDAGFPIQLTIRLDPFKPATSKEAATQLAWMDANVCGVGYIYNVGELWYRIDPSKVRVFHGRKGGPYCGK